MAFIDNCLHNIGVPSKLLFKAIFGYAVAAMAIAGTVMSLFWKAPNLPVTVLFGLAGAALGVVIARMVSRAGSRNARV